MPIVEDPISFPVAERLRDCLCNLLEDSLPTKCCCIWYGSEVPWDDCSAEGGREGQSWVRIVDVYPTDQFPRQATVSNRCGAHDGWAVVLELGVLRCAPAPAANGRLPGCDANTAAAEKAAHDAHLMRRAIMCCDWREPDQTFLMGRWQPIGADGGCHGGVTQVTVHVEYPCLCEQLGGE